MSHPYNFHFISILLISSFCFNTALGAVASERGEETDRLALLDVKSKILGGSRDDPQGLLASWNNSLHHCRWEGVTCGHSHRRVTVLDLSSRSLSGSLSPAIGNLSFLENLSVAGNEDLHGQIPPQIGLLSRLRILSASQNSLEGEIPANLSRCRLLEQLQLNRNKLEGSIPPEFISLTHLRILVLYSNRLTGTIQVFGNLTSLERLDIDTNGFQGKIPGTIGRLKSLTVLSLGGNSFTGPVPSSIYNLSKLTLLSFGGSPVHGSLPENLGLTLPRLRTLHIMDCRVGGPIPTSLSNLSDIETIDLSKNRFSGRVPLNGRNLPKLSGLYLAANKFLGTGGPDDLGFLDSLVNCSRLYRIILSINQLGGVLPPSVANLSRKMERLELGANRISGHIPPGLDNLVNLQVLNLAENRFTGSIPDYIGQLRALGAVDFYGNEFTGAIPVSLGNLSQLATLYLGSNRLQGTIPSSLGDCLSLQELDLELNRLTGEIPPHLFDASRLSKGLILSGNQFWGSLPQEIGQLRNLGLLDVSDNRLSGKIPQSLDQCNSLTEVDMGGNFFSGSIPESLRSLKGLSTLDLSRNNLSGQIPSYLSNFTLVSLNLSFNNLEGEVPMKGIFTNASAVSLVGNERLCGGITQLHLHKCLDAGHSKGKKKTRLIILLISILSLLVGVTIALLLIQFGLKRKRKSDSSGSPLGDSTFLKVSYSTLLKATEGFSSGNLIGMGSFGSVYRGILNVEGNTIAIAAKVLNLQHRGSAKSFMRECEALRNIRHRNLISIISACSSIDFQGNDFKALVYEFMPEGSLDQWLHQKPVPQNSQENENQSGGPQSLSLLQRVNIAIDVASALDYLHHDCETPIVHCDLKPSNILLDNDMVAHVGDFGLARLLPEEIISQSLSHSTGVQGTIGYAPPEYGLGNQISTSGDVYSYGIILLEMMTAKRPIDQMFQNTLNLHDYAKIAIPSDAMEIVDPKLACEIIVDIQSSRRVSNARKLESLVSVIKVGVECSVESPQDRMNIKDAVRDLKVAKDFLMGTRRV